MPDIAKALKALQAGHISPAEFDNYLKTGSIGKADPTTPQARVAAQITATPTHHPNNFMVPQGHSLSSLLPSGFQKGGNPMSTIGALGAAGAAALTGGGALPVMLAGAGGAMSKTPGDAAQSTVLGGVSNFLPGQGSSRIMQALKGALAGGALQAGGDQVKSLVDNHSLAEPNKGAIALGALLGGVGGAAGAKPAGALTDEQKAAAIWQQKEAQRAAHQLELEHQKLNLGTAAVDKKDAMDAVQAAHSRLSSAIAATKSSKAYDAPAMQAKVELAEKQLDNSINLANAKQALADSRAKQNAGDLADLYPAQKRLVQTLEARTPLKAKSAAYAQTTASEALAEHKAAVAALKSSASRASTYGDGHAQQAQFAADIHANHVETTKAQDAFDDLQRELSQHKQKMAEVEASLRKEDVADTRAKVDDLRNHNTLLSSGRNADGTIMSEEQSADAPWEKAKNTIQSRLLSREAVDTNSGVNPIDTIHKPEVLKTLEDLTAKHSKAMEDLNAKREAGYLLKQQKLNHRVELANSPQAGTVNQSVYDAVDSSLEKATAAREAARQARSEHLDHLDAVKSAKEDLVTASPDRSAAAVSPNSDVKAAHDLYNQHLTEQQELARQKIRLGLIAPETADAADTSGIAAAARAHEEALARASAARAAHSDLSRSVIDSKHKLLDLNPGEAPEVGSGSGLAGHAIDMLPVPKIGKTVLKGILAAARQKTKAPEPPSEFMKRLQEISSGANAGQPMVPGAVDMLRELLSSSQQGQTTEQTTQE